MFSILALLAVSTLVHGQTAGENEAQPVRNVTQPVRNVTQSVVRNVTHPMQNLTLPVQNVTHTVQNVTQPVVTHQNLTQGLQNLNQSAVQTQQNASRILVPQTAADETVEENTSAIQNTTVAPSLAQLGGVVEQSNATLNAAIVNASETIEQLRETSRNITASLITNAQNYLEANTTEEAYRNQLANASNELAKVKAEAANVTTTMVDASAVMESIKNASKAVANITGKPDANANPAHSSADASTSSACGILALMALAASF